MNGVLSLRAPLYLRNLAILKAYGGVAYKLVQCACVRNRGVEDDSPRPQKGTVNSEKLSSNIVRARSKIREYGLCNPWEFFVTMTINPEYFNRYNLKEFKKVLSQWIRNYNKKYGTNIKYLLIPEKHKNGAWHLHGFIMGLPKEHLTPFTLEQKLPQYIREKLLKGEEAYDWRAYQERFGWVNVEPIRSREKATSYITKYITKDLEATVTELGAHLYYCSQGLERAKEVKKGAMAATITPDYENDFCKVNWFDGSHTVEELSSLIADDEHIISS